MKRMSVLLLTLLLACGILMSCNNEAPKETSKGNETIQSETSAQTEEIIKDYDQVDFQHGFSIKGKGYYYKGNDMKGIRGYPAGEVLLLSVTNETDTNYTAILSVTYFDENGKKIKTETQKFKQFAAGYQRYFLFTPQDSYASYTCELSLTEYTGEIWADKISFSEIMETSEDETRIRGENSSTNYPVIFGKIECVQQPHPELKLSREVIIFDNTGEIYVIQKLGDKKYIPISEPSVEFLSTLLFYTTEKKLVCPEELTGELKGIVIFDILE